jgi:hypothetical protein
MSEEKACKIRADEFINIMNAKKHRNHSGSGDRLNDSHLLSEDRRNSGGT